MRDDFTLLEKVLRRPPRTILVGLEHRWFQPCSPRQRVTRLVDVAA
jgi:hypothetical protein